MSSWSRKREYDYIGLLIGLFLLVVAKFGLHPFGSGWNNYLHHWDLHNRKEVKTPRTKATLT